MRKYGSLKSMEEELQGCHFLRIHKNYLVNQEYEEGNKFCQKIYLKHPLIFRYIKTAFRYIGLIFKAKLAI